MGSGADGCSDTMTDTNTRSEPENVVAHYADGRVVKGQTEDFSAARPTFTLIPLDGADNREPLDVRLQDLKAVFFVKDFAGDPDYSEWKHFEVPRLGLHVAVKFTDGEVMVGAQLPLTNDYGFLLFPADRGSNNERVFVVSAAVTVVEQVPG
jgi:hypothetical protein